MVGKPINQPYKETFEGGSVQNNFAWTESNEQHASRRNSSPWMISGKASSNDDGGGVVWSPYTIPDPEFPEYYNVEAGDETSFNLPKVALNGVDQPVVRFNLYSENGEQSDLTVVVQTPDGVNHDVKTFKLSEKKTSGWETLTVDLTPYTNERYIIVKFRGTLTPTTLTSCSTRSTSTTLPIPRLAFLLPSSSRRAHRMCGRSTDVLPAATPPRWRDFPRASIWWVAAR